MRSLITVKLISQSMVVMIFLSQWPASLAQLVVWLLPWLGSTGFESRSGWPCIFTSPHHWVCKSEFGTLPIKGGLHARLNNQLSHPILLKLKSYYNKSPITTKVQPKQKVLLQNNYQNESPISTKVLNQQKSYNNKCPIATEVLSQPKSYKSKRPTITKVLFDNKKGL